LQIISSRDDYLTLLCRCTYISWNVVCLCLLASWQASAIFSIMLLFTCNKRSCINIAISECANTPFSIASIAEMFINVSAAGWKTNNAPLCMHFVCTRHTAFEICTLCNVVVPCCAVFFQLSGLGFRRFTRSELEITTLPITCGSRRNIVHEINLYTFYAHA